jgi:TonB family protein
MTRRFVSLIVLATALSGPVDLLARLQQKREAAQQKAQKKETVSCWPGEPEIQNANPGKHRPGRLPPELANAKVQRSAVLLKLCIAETGDVARVLVLESSGHPDVDKHFTTELSKWTFAPAERDKKRVRSVLPVTILLHPKQLPVIQRRDEPDSQRRGFGSTDVGSSYQISTL